MNEAIDSPASTTFAGKRFTRQQLVQIQQTVKDCGRLSLREVGHTVCEHLNGVTPGGKHRIQRCLNALKEMEGVGLFRLPEKQARLKKAKQPSLQWSDQTAPQPDMFCRQKIRPGRTFPRISKKPTKKWQASKAQSAARAAQATELS